VADRVILEVNSLPEKIIAVVPRHDPDYSPPSRPADGDPQMIAGHVVDYLTHEVRRGRPRGRSKL
jgi:succinyl-CoA:acetate CoA-transferase